MVQRAVQYDSRHANFLTTEEFETVSSVAFFPASATAAAAASSSSLSVFSSPFLPSSSLRPQPQPFALRQQYSGWDTASAAPERVSLSQGRSQQQQQRRRRTQRLVAPIVSSSSSLPTTSDDDDGPEDLEEDIGNAVGSIKQGIQTPPPPSLSFPSSSMPNHNFVLQAEPVGRIPSWNEPHHHHYQHHPYRAAGEERVRTEKEKEKGSMQSGSRRIHLTTFVRDAATSCSSGVCGVGGGGFSKQNVARVNHFVEAPSLLAVPPPHPDPHSHGHRGAPREPFLFEQHEHGGVKRTPLFGNDKHRGEVEKEEEHEDEDGSSLAQALSRLPPSERKQFLQQLEQCLVALRGAGRESRSSKPAADMGSSSPRLEAGGPRQSGYLLERAKRVLLHDDDGQDDEEDDEEAASQFTSLTDRVPLQRLLAQLQRHVAETPMTAAVQSGNGSIRQQLLNEQRHQQQQNRMAEDSRAAQQQQQQQHRYSPRQRDSNQEQLNNAEFRWKWEEPGVGGGGGVVPLKHQSSLRAVHDWFSEREGGGIGGVRSSPGGPLSEQQQQQSGGPPQPSSSRSFAPVSATSSEGWRHGLQTRGGGEEALSTLRKRWAQTSAEYASFARRSVPHLSVDIPFSSRAAATPTTSHHHSPARHVQLSPRKWSSSTVIDRRAFSSVDLYSSGIHSPFSNLGIDARSNEDALFERRKSVGGMNKKGEQEEEEDPAVALSLAATQREAIAVLYEGYRSPWQDLYDMSP